MQRSHIFALLAVFFWSTVATSFKLALRELDYIQLLFICSTVSLIFFGTVLAFQGKLKLTLRNIFKNPWTSILFGLLNPFTYYLILFKAYSLLPAQLAQPLNMVWPIVLVFLSSPILKQKISSKSYIALFISFGGVLFISAQGDLNFNNPPNLTGVLLALASSILWSLYWLYSVKDKRSESEKLFGGFLVSSVFITGLTAFTSGFQFEFNMSFFASIYSGLFEMGITYLLWLTALKTSNKTDEISNYVFIAPFVSLIFIHTILKEEIYYTTFIGLIFIIVSIFVQQFKFKKR